MPLTSRSVIKRRVKRERRVKIQRHEYIFFIGKGTNITPLNCGANSSGKGGGGERVKNWVEKDRANMESPMKTEPRTVGKLNAPMWEENPGTYRGRECQMSFRIGFRIPI